MRTEEYVALQALEHLERPAKIGGYFRTQARLGDLAAARDALRRLRAFDPDAADSLLRTLFAGKGGAVGLTPVGKTDDPSGQ